MWPLRRYSTVTSNLASETEAVTDVSFFCQVFYVIKGTVMVTVHQCSTVLRTGSTFFVPQGKFLDHFSHNFAATQVVYCNMSHKRCSTLLTCTFSSGCLTNFFFTFYLAGNSYNIKNLKKTDAKLMFVQIKG